MICDTLCECKYSRGREVGGCPEDGVFWFFVDGGYIMIEIRRRCVFVVGVDKARRPGEL